MSPMDRRLLLKLMGASSSMLLAPALFPCGALAQTPSKTKLLQIFLQGGWDTILATDPVRGPADPKANASYEAAYYDGGNGQFAGAAQAVPGKSNLWIGPGLAPAAAAFAAVPTAFVNGLFVEVTAHELAYAYVLSGILSLSRSREYPSFIARMAAKTGGFPAHVVLGGGIPLAETAAVAPPLHSLDVDILSQMLSGPYKAYGQTPSEGMIAAAHDLIATLNTEYQKRLPDQAKTGLTAWNTSSAGIGELYAHRYDQKIIVDDAVHSRYSNGGAASPNVALKNDSPAAKIACAHQILKCGMTRYVTVGIDGFDTHQSHLAAHKPRQQEVARALNALIADLCSTPDPDDPAKMLIETTTVLVTSEFSRTPAFNAAAGTDHWQSASAILMGRGIADNTVVGATDTAGHAADYNGAKLLPDHLAASLLRLLGFDDEAAIVSGVQLNALFA